MANWSNYNICKQRSWHRDLCHVATSQLQAELNSSFRGSFALNRWLSVVQIASEVFIYRWDAWSLVYLPGICFMLSLTAGENGAIIINKWHPCQNNKQNFSFFFLLWWLSFSASAFMDGRDGVREKSFPTRRKQSEKWTEEAWGGQSQTCNKKLKRSLFWTSRSFQS